MRLGPIPGDLVECPLGEEFTLVADPDERQDPRELTCSYRELPNDLKPGETVLFADGTVAMTCTDAAPGRARLKVTLPGRLAVAAGAEPARLGPGRQVAHRQGPARPRLDRAARRRRAVRRALVRPDCAEDVAWLRRELAARKCPAKIVVKIEKPQAVQNLEAIVAATDGVMVARGDLGVEMDVQRVPAIQKRVIALCNQTHRPVITATQMLNSMEHSSRPTRAEASDVFNAVLDGTDAVMLSGETAVGEYPVEAVATMRQICARGRGVPEVAATPADPWSTPASLAGFVEPITEATVDAACLVAERLDAPLIVVATDSGRTALALSNRRPSATILAVTRTEQVARTLALCWGVTPLVLPQVSSAEQELAFAIDWAKSHRFVHSGQHVVFIRGEMPGQIKSRAVLTHEAP